MQSKKLNKGEDSMKTCQIMLFGVGIAVISLRLGFRRNVLSVLHPNLVSSPIKGILEIFNLTPGAFRWIFWHGRIVSDQVQVRFHK